MHILTTADADNLARIMGLSWKALDNHGHKELLELAEHFAYHNVIAQRKAGDRITLRSKYVAQWHELMGS